MTDASSKEDAAKSGVILRARNGDVIRYDPSGLVMVLSDRVIADIAQRLPEKVNGGGEAVDAAVLGDVDAWDVRAEGEWFVFSANLPGRQGARRFRRLIEPDDAEHEPHIFADAGGAVRGIFSLGGPRRATGYKGTPDFPWHIVSPGDEIGPVGCAGVEAAKPVAAVQPATEITRDVALADEILRRRFDNYGALPLTVVRAETDSSGDLAGLLKGQAYQNLIAAIRSMRSSAERLGKRAVPAALSIEFTLEDLRSDGAAYLAGMRALITRLRADIAKIGLRAPPILALFDCGTHAVNDSPVLRAQWELAWQNFETGLVYVAPNYMFRQNKFGRYDLDTVRRIAEMEAHALEHLEREESWTCPIFLLAEREPDPAVIRVRARAMEDLVIEADDPFGAGPGCGFSLEGAKNAPELLGVAVAEDDPQDLLLTFDKPPEGDALTLFYAFGQTPERGTHDYPAACGAIRDTWSAPGHGGDPLHRWAYPAALPVH